MFYCKHCERLIVDEDAAEGVEAILNSYRTRSYDACPHCGEELVNLPEES